MYWLLSRSDQQSLRRVVDELVHSLAPLTDNPQNDQIFPYVGRKDRRKAETTINILTTANDVVLDPFVGSGTFAYAAANTNRRIKANEWEPYANRMSNSPWHLPSERDLNDAMERLTALVERDLNFYYRTICVCGHVHVLDSMFFDRSPLNFANVELHERLGPNNETITYRGKHKCPQCERKEKFFDSSDSDHLQTLSQMVLDEQFAAIFNGRLIENSRINLSAEFTIYGNLFPHRSKLSLAKLWKSIQILEVDELTKKFLEDVFLSLLPQAKYKDYRSKSQDLHCPPVKLREVNIWFRFIDQFKLRNKVLRKYSFSRSQPIGNTVVSCKDFRTFIHELEPNTIDLILTDPPWTDGNAYFEKAQLYHPWLDYDLATDISRLQNEFVVTDAPSRRQLHDTKRWWEDLNTLFQDCYHVLKDLKFFAVYFRPIPASKWLENLNSLKFYARKNGFEPILAIDVGSSDPSMRIQQSASFVFSTDIIFLFIKIPTGLCRVFRSEKDVDHLVFQCAEELQEHFRRPFSYREWTTAFSQKVIQEEVPELNNPREENVLRMLFERYCDEVQPGLFLPKPITPFSGQVFDIPAVERIFTYIPHVVNELTYQNERFTYDSFLLKIAEYVENGTRMLIDQLSRLDIRALLSPYAESEEGGRWFTKRLLPTLPEGLKNVFELEPYDFEAFVARLFEEQNFTNVVLAGRSGDRGVDIIAKDPDGHLTVIQCKRWIGNVSATPIQRVHSFAITRGALRKILVTTSDFTDQAVEEAENTSTELINGERLEQMIAQFLPGYFTQ